MFLVLVIYNFYFYNSFRCGRCLCVQFALPAGSPAGTGQCGALDYTSTTTKGTERTTEQIVAYLKKVTDFNRGM